MRHAAAIVGALILASTTVQAQDQAPSLRYSIENPTPGQRLRLQQQFDVLGNCCGSAAQSTGPLEIIVQPYEVAALLAIAPSAKFVDRGRPFHEIVLERAAAAGEDVPDPNYYTVAEIEAAIDAQVALHPTIARKVNLSALPGGVTTIEGRSIYALKVSDNVASDEDEPAIVIAAQHHARELNSPVMVIGAMQRVLAAYGSNATLTAVVNGYELYFVPMVNPDGVNHVWNVDNNWRKNRRNNGGGIFGVDNNRNYPFLWSLCGSSPATNNETYQGPSAGSEAENMIMRNLVDRLRPEIYLDFHSSGQEVLRTYAPCATVNATMFTFIEHYVDDLRAPMTYGKRDPSGSGESPEDHWASGGTLSFLTEIGTSFQPAYSVTTTEEARVWPGIQRALTVWRPARRGHVRSSLGNAPLAATITYTPNVFNHGEVARSRSRDGRYGLWLPIGSWSVTYSAPGHVSQTVPVTVTAYDSTVTADVTLTALCARYVPDSSTAGTLNTIPFGTTAPSSLTTLFATNNSGSIGGAVYFDLAPTNNLFLTGIDLNTSAAAGAELTLDVYTRSGTHAGNEASAAGWSPRTAGHGVAAGTNLPSHVDLNEPILLGVGTTGFAIVARDFSHSYTNGNGVNQNYGDANLAVATGSATNAPFTAPVFTPRVANMEFSYRTDTSAWTNQLYQTILRKDQLAGAAAITGLAFSPGSTGRHFNRELRIRMAHVPAGYTLSTTFAANLPSPVTVLNKWDYTWHVTADQWNEIGLTDPFAYNGTSDVVVEIFARGNHNTVDAGFHRGPGNVPRVSASGFGFGAVPLVATVDDDSGQRIRVSFHCATAQEFGTACGGLRAGHAGNGARGTTFRFQLHDAVPGAPALVSLGFTSFSPFAPSLSGLGFTNCYAWNDTVAGLVYVPDAMGFAEHAIAVPPTTANDGLIIYGTWYQLDATQAGGLTASNQTRVIIGVAP
ncbi:MAG TPA: M14 family zinc carboxypeptidase [Planctomycetota bacterium]|nr:M14 family zinc carboxypeptidase [Planctomycetota bacterium]